MISRVVSSPVGVAFCCILSFLLLPLCAKAQTQTYRLANGMEIILKENHSSPMIASVVFVRSGSKYESRYDNGITHFLEHLLFDGTISLTRKELDLSIRDLGGYINAFTRKDLTAYLVLMPDQYIEYGLTVQADMLFNSVFPEDELAKERKVVIEEIRQSADSPGAAAEGFFTSRAYGGTSYSRPVLGYESFIENIPREAIVDYWKRYYIPSNMTALIIGDFETDAMRETLASIFGTISDSTAAISPADTAAIEVTIGDVLVGAEVFDTLADVKSTYVNVSIAAPHFTDSTYLPFDLLTQYLAMDGVSPLVKALRAGDSPLATEVGVSLTTREEFSRLEISVITDEPGNSAGILTTVLDQLKAISGHIADPETVAGIKTTVRCDDIYYSEKLHFYSFIIAPMMMSAGWDFLQDYPDRLSRVSWDQCRQAAGEWLAEPDYVATIVRPVGDSPNPPWEPPTMPAADVTAYFDTAQFVAYDLTVGYPLEWPETDSVDYELKDPAEYHYETLANGLTLIIKSSPDSRVFAMNVLGKNRTASEPDGKEGITDFVQRCLEKGTATRNARELSRDLAGIGANVTLYDNPWIPYDDRYTTRRFSFLKFETIDAFAEKGFYLFCEMLLYPAFDSVEAESVRRSMFGILGRDAGSPRKVARNLFYETMFGDGAYARSISGTPQSIGSITIEDLREHHTCFYSPGNLILSITTNKPVATIRRWVDRVFGRMTAGYPPAQGVAGPVPIHETRTAHRDLESEQISLYLGSPLPGAASDDVAALNVAASVLSTRLYLNLREKQGLAYSVGAGAVFDKDFGWQYSVISTAPDNYQKALDGITLEIEKLKLDGPTQSEITSARNHIWGRLGIAKLSRINQAYYLAVDKYLGRSPGYDSRYLKALSEVTVDSVRRVMGRYFRTDACVLVSAGRKP
ncbi:MAG: insulinase family protein [candidate division Zixibacteria bacterium]|nr:insulinase family protein [candidate division Zixibacteria bacterium]